MNPLVNPNKNHRLSVKFLKGAAGNLQNPVLKESEAKYRSFFENSMDGMLLIVTDGQILAANPAACDIFKMTENEICEAGRFGLADITDARVARLIETRRRNGRAKGEITLVRKDGTKFQAEITSTDFKDDNGEDRTSMIIRDVTENKQGEQKLITTTRALKLALSDLEKIMDSSLDVICSVDENGNFIKVSAASESIWGYQPDELFSRKYMDLVFGDDVDKTIKVATKIMNRIPVTFFENRFVHKDGSTVPMIWSAQSDNKITYWIGKNATAKKKLEKAFEIERQRFVDLFLNAPSCVGVLQGPDHIFAMANHLYLKLIDKTDIIGRSIKSVLPESAEQGFIELLDGVYKTGETFTASEILFKLHKQGKPVEMYLNLIYQAYKNNEGTIDGIFFFIVDVTDQVLSRKKLEESERQYFDLIQNLPAAIYSTNAQGDIKIYNKAAVKLWGRKPDLQKDKWVGAHQLYKPDGTEIPHIESPMAQTLKKGKAEIYGEILIKRPDGSMRNVLPNPIPLFDEGGKLKGAINMLIDITEIRESEKSLEKSETKYRQMVETAQEGIWVIDENNKTNFVNNKMCEMIGYTVDQLMGNVIHLYLTEDDRKVSHEQINRRKKGVSEQHELKFITKSGKVLWTQISTNPIFDGGGKYKGALAMITDITENVAAQQALRESEKKYRQIVETGQEGMWMIDKNNITIFVNKKMCEILEYTEAEMMGRTNLSFKDEEEQKKALQQIERRKKGLNETHESTFITKSGRRIWTQVSTNPVLTEDGTYNGALAMMTDITEKKQLQQQLLTEQINKQKDITKAAINAQEKERSDIGEELHDNVNQLLAASKLYLNHSLTVEDDYKPFIIKTQDYISQAIEEIRKLTKALTGPAKEETMGLVVTIMELLSNISTVKDIKFSFRHTAYFEEGTDTGLKVVIYRIIQEQINNILKHAEATDVTIELQNKQECMQLIIKDNGKGFDTSASKKGIGLKNIANRAEIYDGKMEIISSPGNGCTLKIIFKECG